MIYNKLKHAFLVTITLITGMQFTFAQIPAIEWQNTIGGEDQDLPGKTIQTSDGGYLVGGGSNSEISGDKTIGVFDEFTSSLDIWIVKLSAAGDIEWQRVLGNESNNNLAEMEQTMDGGYIIGGATGDNYYVCKLNSEGDIEWERTYGSTEEDDLESIDQTPDGGYFIAGHSNGDLVGGGDKTETAHGASKDYWVLKIDADGDIEWQNTIGGNQDEYIADAIVLNDGGYLLLGDSESNISFDKAENCLGDQDFWIVKLDATGAVVWQETLGGENSEEPHDLIETLDGGFIVIGTSGSPASPDKSESSVNSDYWVVKFDSDYEMEWENTINGSSLDYGFAVAQFPDGSFLVGGNSMSPVSGDKTKKYKGSLMNQDYWILKLTAGGVIEWQEVYGGKDYDFLRTIELTSDNGIVLGGYSHSNISGNKTEMGNGLEDYWIIKLEGTCLPVAETCNSLDDNCNGLIDDEVTESISISSEGATTFCKGESVLLSATHSGSSVQWKKNGTDIAGATNASYSASKSGNYTAVTTSPCDTATSDIIPVTVNKTPGASISAGGATSFCEGGSVTLNVVPVGGSTYQWYKGASPLAGATNTSYIATTAGNYKCRVTKTATGCFKNSNAISVTVPCKEGEATHHSSLTTHSFPLYPNPNNGIFTISGSLHEANIEIYNALGQLVYAKQLGVGDANETIELKDISPGVYSIAIHKGELQSKQQFIIQQ